MRANAGQLRMALVEDQNTSSRQERSEKSLDSITGKNQFEGNHVRGRITKVEIQKKTDANTSVFLL